MSNSLVLNARFGGGRVELTPVPHPHDPKFERPTWRVRLVGRGFEGTATAGQHGGLEIPVDDGLVAEMVCPESPWEDQLLHEFFDELYADRQGWDGERRWVSQLEHLTFVVVHDQVNTATLRAELRGLADPPWMASVTLPLDPGVFHRIGANAKLFGDQVLEGASADSA
ncbi:MAG: hypothetical protein QOD69_2758 [Solirubrobacteraceae bacterium]|jgi:hypothetical protein|nr:hypothetical protein [Solirubrobacteraceae bacterium]